MLGHLLTAWLYLVHTVRARLQRMREFLVGFVLRFVRSRAVMSEALDDRGVGGISLWLPADGSRGSHASLFIQLVAQSAQVAAALLKQTTKALEVVRREERKGNQTDQFECLPDKRLMKARRVVFKRE